MKAAWVVPHPTMPWPDGHTSRAEVACNAVPGLFKVETLEHLSIIPWDLAVFDTWAESRCAAGAHQLQARGCRLCPSLAH